MEWKHLHLQVIREVDILHGQTETEAVDVAWWWSISDHEATEITVTVMGDLWLRIICLLITE